MSQLCLSPWKKNEDFAGNPRAFLSVSLDSGYAYLLGGHSEDHESTKYYDDIYYAKLDSHLDWKKAINLPSSRSGSGSVVYNNYIYVVGGKDGRNVLGDVYYAKINKEDHLIEAWNPTKTLNIPRYKIGLQIVKENGQAYLVAIAGVSPSLKFDALTCDSLDSIEVAFIKPDGSLEDWTLYSNCFKNDLSAPATFAKGNKLYVLGGLVSETAISHIYWTTFDTGGRPGPWKHNPTSLMKPISAHTVEVYGRSQPTAIVLGGKGNGVDQFQEKAQLAVVHERGDIGIFKDDYTERFPDLRWGHGSVLYENRLYIFGGQTSSGFLKDVQFSEIISLP